MPCSPWRWAWGKNRVMVLTPAPEHTAGQLRDHHSRRFYAGLPWKVVLGKLYPWRLLAAIQRVMVDMREGWGGL